MIFLERPSFSNHLKKISYFHVFLRNIIFYFPSKKYDHIFGEEKYHLPWWYKKDHISVRFFGKTISSEHLQKENMVLYAFIFGRNIYISSKNECIKTKINFYKVSTIIKCQKKILNIFAYQLFYSIKFIKNIKTILLKSF